MKKFLSAALIVGSLLFMPTTQAEVQTYMGNGEYYMSDFETFDVAQKRAKQRAEQNACEQAGVFVKSVSRSINSKIVEDEIIAMTSGILKVVDVQFKRENFYNNTTLIRVTIYANIDSDDVLKWLNKSETERAELIKQIDDLRRANAAQEKQIDELKHQLAAATAQQDKDEIAQQFAAEDKIFLSNQKVSEAWQHYYRKDFGGAIKLHTEAIELNPENALAYYGRAYAYDDLKNYRQAIVDCTKAVQFDSPRLVDAYNNRGEAYRKSGDYRAAIADYNKALELNPNYIRAYNNRGLAYQSLGNYKQAFADYDKAIKLKPDYALAYYNRGYAYKKLGQYELAFADYDKAIKLKPDFAVAYYNRGYANLQLKNYKRAVADFSKYIKLAPDDADGYTNRGVCYLALGDAAKAQADFDEAKRLGNA